MNSFRNNINRAKIFFAAVLALLGISGAASAQTFDFPAATFVDSMSLRSIVASSGCDTIKVRHDQYAYMTGPATASAFTVKSLKAIARALVNPYSAEVANFPKAQYVFTYRTIGVANPASAASSTVISATDTMDISYAMDSLKLYNDHSFRIAGAYHDLKIVVCDVYKIEDVPGTGVVYTLQTPSMYASIPPYISVLAEIQIQKFMNFTASSLLSSMTVSNKIKTEGAVLINLSSLNSIKPAGYEVEWTYVDKDPAITAPRYNFRNNATRIYTNATTFNIPVAERDAYLVFRVRMVRPSPTNFAERVYGTWSLPTDQGFVSSLTSKQSVSVGMSRNDTINWNVNTHFVEDGKYKQVMTYYDGLYKTKQSLTRFNSRPGQMIIMQQLYDYQFRPVVSSLPIPVYNYKKFDYFNHFLRPDTSTYYHQLTYDAFPDTTLCPLRETLMPPLLASSQANKYYSTYKADKSGHNAYIPDAGGYPFTRKIIAPENNDKVLFEGSAGLQMQLGNNRHISYLYGAPLQAELNRYYGQDIGKANYYRKLVKTDNNTQDQFTVTDDQGKTIMSGMIGTPDTNALALSVRKAPVAGRFSTNLLPRPHLRFDDNWEQNGSYFVELDANYSFDYNIRYRPYKPCSTRNIGLLPKVYYDYEVIDYCGNIKLSDVGTLGETGYTTSPEITYSKASTTYLSKGNHVWNKRTYIRNTDLLASVDAFLNIPGGCFKTYNDFVKEEFLKLELPCKDDYDPCGALREKMKRELYPREKYGQYTPVDSIHYRFSGPAPKSIFTAYSDPLDPQPQYLYQVSCLTYPDSIYANGSFHKNLRFTGPQTFIDIFTDEIAEALLPLHPDYCKLKFCEQNQNVYDQFLAAIKSSRQAKSVSRFTLTDIINNDPLKLNGLFTSSELSYIAGDSLTIAGRAFINTICGSGISAVDAACTEVIKDKDETYITTYPLHIQDEFYATQLQLYLSNRYKMFKHKLANVEDTCGPCAANRIKDPAPFMVSMEEKMVSFADFSGVTPFRRHADLFDTSGTSTDSVGALIGVGTDANCAAKVGYIMDGLISCNISAAQRAMLQDTLLALYCGSGPRDIAALTPDSLQAFMLSLGIPATDLCNPYLVSLNSLAGDVSTVQRLGLLQYSSRYYYNMAGLLTENQLLEFFNSTRDTQSVVLTLCEENPFHLSLARKLGITAYSPACTTTATVLVLKNTAPIGESNANRLRFVYSTDTLDFYCYPGLGKDTNRLSTLSGTTALIENIEDLQAIPLQNKYGYDNYANTLALRNSVILRFKGKLNGASHSFQYFLSAFDPAKDYLAVEKDTTPNLNGMVCSEFIHANKPLLQKAGSLGIAVGHPSFNAFYTNYFNYHNGLSIDMETFTSSFASCGLADSVILPRLQSHFRLTIPNTVGTYYLDTMLRYISRRDTFSIANMTAYAAGTRYHISFDIGNAGKDILFPAIQNAISAMLPSGSSIELFPRLHGDTIAQLISNAWMPLSATALSAAFPGQSISSQGITNYFFGHCRPVTPYIAGTLYTIRHTGALTPYQLNHLIDSIYSFVHASAPITTVFTAAASAVSPQFRDWQYKAWNTYVNSLPADEHNAAIKSVRAAVLKNISASSGPSSFATSAFSYGTFNQPALINDLYIDHKPNTDPIFLYFRSLFTGLEAFNNGTFGKKSVFALHPPGYKVSNLVFTGTETRVYRCADTNIWLLNHFDTAKLMTNIFFIAPKSMLLHKSSYSLHSVQKAFSSDSFTSFDITMTAAAGTLKDTVRMLAYATLNMGSPYIIRNALLANDPTRHSQEFYFSNCEQDRIEPVHYLATIRYHNYRDSIREVIAARFRQHIIDSLVENLDVKGSDIKHGLTLYYYDVAGNLIRTVPPAGIDTVSVLAPHNDSVNAHRLRDERIAPLIPAHGMATRYKYNAQNKVIYTSTPDGGVTNIYNDLVGRAICSQNARQAPLNEYTYSVYDNLSRVIETGTLIAPMGISTDYLTGSSADFRAYVQTFARKEVTANVYDTAAYATTWVPFVALPPQQNLKNRIAAVKYFSAIPPSGDAANDTAFQQASYYSYDVLGNVATLIHDYRQEMPRPLRFKRIDYEYDLYSGKVLLISYNRGHADQMFQKYEYDEDNRIIAAYNSSNGIYWDKDAQYKYYDHGPLARTELGDKRVQGIDFAYTINGWLKAINGIQNHADIDMGNDGATGKIMPTDVFSQRIDYFGGDYTPIANPTKFTRLAQNPKSLYNGNIAGVAHALTPFANLYKDYRYDPLQRIEKADYASYTASIAPTATPGSATRTYMADYSSRYSYDHNGNLLALSRQGADIPAIFAGGTAISRQQMDNFYYKYYSGTNRLKNLSDSAAATAYRIDVQQHTPDTADALYLYDATGNLTKDVMTGLEDISWNSRGKVASIKKIDGLILNFSYDALGNRTSKEEIRKIGTDSLLKTSTLYVREASGNILAIYGQKKMFVTSTTDLSGGIIHVGTPTMPGLPFDLAHELARSMLATHIAHPEEGLVPLIAGMPTLADIAATPAAIDRLIAEKMSDSLLAGFMKSMPGIAQQALGVGSQQAPAQTVVDRYLYAIMLSSRMEAAMTELFTIVKNDNAQVFDQLIAGVPASQSVKDAFPADPALIDAYKGMTPYDKAGINSQLAGIWAAAGPTLQQSLLNTILQAYSADNAYTGFITDLPDYSTRLAGFRTDARTFAGSQFALVNSQQLPLDTLVARWSASHELLLAAADTISLTTDLLAGILSSHTDAAYRLALSSGKLPAFAAAFDHILRTDTRYDEVLTSRYLRKDILVSHTLHLAEHHLYGSSRLGIQRYLPSEYSYNADSAEAGSYHSLLAPRSWYSRYANDLFAAGNTTGALLSAHLSLADMPLHHHILGNRQFELTNHLGNVQATVLDRTHPRFGTPVGNARPVTGYMANIATAQDYFPFGMYMPGRYISDTARHCITINKRMKVAVEVPVRFFHDEVATTGTLGGYTYRYGDSPAPPEVYALPKAASPAVEKPHVYHLLPASQHTGGAVLHAAAGPDSTVVYTIDLGGEPAPVYSYLHLHPDTNSATYTLSLSLTHTQGVVVEVRVRQYSGAGQSSFSTPQEWQTIPNGQPYTLSFTTDRAAIAAGGPTFLESRSSPAGGSTFAAGTDVSYRPVLHTITEYVERTVMATICDEKDNYRFGFAAGEKINEIAGIGNHVDLGDRGVDTRLGRLNWRTDPDFHKYPSLSPYAYAANSPLKFIDELGRGPRDKVVMFTGALLIPGYQRPTPTMYNIQRQVAQFTGSVSMYNTAYPLGMADDNKSMINHAVADIKAWRTANPDAQLTLFGYSYGGVAAHDLSRALDKEGVKVNLLITLDAADGKNSDKIDRTIPANVVKNINYYQTNAKKAGSDFKNWIGSKGGANSRAKGNTKTEIINIDNSKSSYSGSEDYYNGKVNHYNIDDKNQGNIIDDVKKVEGEPIQQAPTKCVPEKL